VQNIRKHLLRIVLAVVVLALVLPGAGHSTRAAAEPSGTINFAFWNYGPDAQPGWESIIAEFNKQYPNIKVNLISATGGNWGEYLDGVAQLIAGGEKPDLMWVATEGVQLLVNQLKIAVPLDDYMAKDKAALQEYLTDVNPQLLKAFQVGGKQY